MLLINRYSLLRNVRALISCSLLALLIGCGFTLRGNIEIPIEAQSVWLAVEGNKSRELRSSFESLARQNNLSIDEFADYHLIVTNINFRRIVTTVTSDADVDEYTLRAEVDFDIVDKNDEVLANGLDAFAERTFTYDANDASASNSQEAFLNREIWQNLASQMLRQYSAFFRLKAK